MDEVYQVVLKVLAAFFVTGILSFLLTPPVKRLAHRIGAIDVPKDARRMHKKPIPRLGGLAIYISFVIVSLVLGQWNMQNFTILIGSAIIVVLGIFDDRNALSAKFKFGIQLIAAAIPVVFGNLRIELITNPNLFSGELCVKFGALAIPITIIWIVAITNAVNLIDGLDGLAVGVSAIACMTMLAVSLLIGEVPIAILLAVLAGACVGFMPFNLNPASIFMGDTGSTFLGFMLATLSIQGMFKVYAIISFAVPFLILGLPIFDTAFAFTRRILSGRSPFSPDRGHVHHRLIDMGFNQKQTVAILYIISTVLGLLAVVLTTSGEYRAIVMVLVVLITCVVGGGIYLSAERRKMKLHEQKLHELNQQENEQQKIAEQTQDADDTSDRGGFDNEDN